MSAPTVLHLDNAVHHGGQRAPSRITLLVLHSTEGGSARSSIEYLNSTGEKKASYHYLIDRDGTVLRMTAPLVVAWHAGDSAWPSPRRATPENPTPNGTSVNPISLGIAWANNGEPLTAAAIDSAEWLCRTLMRQYAIPAERVVGHYEVSPGRKSDPSACMKLPAWRALLRRVPASP